MSRIIPSLCIVVVLSLSPLVFAAANLEPLPPTELIIQPEDTFVPDSPLVKAEKDFTFAWDDATTIEPNKNKIDALETMAKKACLASNYTVEDRKALGQLLYKLATYYTHVINTPDVAIPEFEKAQQLLTQETDLIWNKIQLAYAYAQKFGLSDNASDKKNALHYAQVIIKKYPHTQNKEVAFAYYVTALTLNNAKDYAKAQTNYEKALKIYDTLSAQNDDQYLRTKSRLAQTMLDQNNHDAEALAILEQTADNWQARGHLTENPYAAKNLIVLGKAYLKVNKTEPAQDKFNQAIAIYAKLFGDKSILLIEPYEDLADTYKILGNLNQMDTYLQKANALEKS